MQCTLFSVAEAELQPASGDLPAYSEGDSLRSITTAPMGIVLELGTTWNELHAALGAHDGEHPLGFLVAGGSAVPSMATTTDAGRSFSPAATIDILAWVARLDDARVRKLRQFLADAVLAKHGILVHTFAQ